MKRKILFYSDRFGGPTLTFVYNDLIAVSQHHEVLYLCTEINPENTFSFDRISVVPYVLDPIRRKIRWLLEKRGLFLSFRNRSFANQTNRIISDFRPDIIQCQFGYEALRLTSNLSEENRRIPIVINFLGYDASFHLKRPSYVRKLKELAKWENVYATCNTTFLKNNLESKGIVFKENQIIYTGIRQDFFARDISKILPVDRFVFLQIAVQSERKGQRITIKSFKIFLELVKNPEKYFLHIAGGDENSYSLELQSLVKELGLQDKVLFTGWITPDVAKELMQNANCFVHHSRTVAGKTEGIPTAITEAMSMELPIIATYHAGIPELVEDGVNGYLVNEDDVEAYALKMNEIVSWGLMPINREKVAVQFSMETRINKFEEYYNRILKEKK